MKNVLLTTVLMVVFSLLGNAQDVKSQSEELATIQTGKYTAYLTHQNGDKYIGGIDDRDYEVVKFEDYKVQPGAHKVVRFINSGNRERPDDQKAYMYMPNHEVFPIMYVEGSYEGTPELQQEVGYVNKVSTRRNTDRIVFLDGRIYVLESYTDKDNYILKAVLEYEAKPLNAFKVMKEVMASPKKMAALKPHQTLQNYFDAAAAKQQSVYAEWIKNPANKSMIDKQEATAKLMSQTIRKMDVDWRNSEEFARIQENNHRAEESRKANNVTVKNNTGRSIYVFEEGSRNGTSIFTNSSASCNCKVNLYYSFSSSDSSPARFYSAGQDCGGTATVD